jgi:hypothetical protein
MSYSKIHPIPGTEDTLLLNWDQGYKNVKIYHQGELIKHIESASSIKKGISFQNEKLGLVELSFTDRPMMIRIMINGITCPAKVGDEGKDLTPVSTTFWILFGLSTLGTISEAIQFDIQSTVGAITLVINLLLTSIYGVAAIFTAKRQPWAYFLGTFTFVGTTLLIVGFNLIGGNILILVHLVIRAFFLYNLFSYFKIARILQQLKNKRENKPLDVLDI